MSLKRIQPVIRTRERTWSTTPAGPPTAHPRVAQLLAATQLADPAQVPTLTDSWRARSMTTLCQSTCRYQAQFIARLRIATVLRLRRRSPVQRQTIPQGESIHPGLVMRAGRASLAR